MNSSAVFIPYTKILLTTSKFSAAARKFHHDIPFINFYRKVTGLQIQDDFVPKLRKKHPNIVNLTTEDLQCTVQILQKFGITVEQACYNPHLFSMNPITMDNYGEILKECQFTTILPKYIIRYHTMVKSMTISQLKNNGLLKQNLNLEEVLFEYYNFFPENQITLNKFEDAKTNIVTVRTSVLEKYLHWRLGVTNEDFKKYCKNYLPMRHRPVCDILESINIAENDIKFSTDMIRRNGFIISSDPTNTKLILENVQSLGCLEIRQAIKLEPAILKNNYQSLLQIKDILKEYNISEEAQNRCLRVFCMQPKTVRERLQNITNLKEYNILATNTRMIYMVVYEKKLLNRLDKINADKKQCYSFNLLVSSSSAFNAYLNNFGEKVCGKDVGALISSLLDGHEITTAAVLEKMKRHKYRLHTALDVIAENIQMLKKYFANDVIFENCQIALYPSSEIKKYINYLLQQRKGETISEKIMEDACYNNLDFSGLTDNQILSLVLYEIEKGYHFSGDGIWSNQDGGKTEQNNDRIQQTS